MADIVIAGAEYHGVPSISIPKIGGGMAEYSEGGGNLAEIIMRPDAEIYKVWSGDALVAEDLGWTIPAYTTSAQTIHTGGAQEETVTLTSLYPDYNLFIIEKFLLTGIYTTDAAVKGKPIYDAGFSNYEVLEIPANTIQWGGKSYTSRSVTCTSRGGAYRMPYWSSTTAISLYTASSYGFHSTVVAPAIASNVLTVSDPTMTMRGSTTYFTSSAWGTLTDIRRQWRVELWRAPKNNLNVNGWEMYQGLQHIIDCAQGSGILT